MIFLGKDICAFQVLYFNDGTCTVIMTTRTLTKKTTMLMLPLAHDRT